MNVLDLFSGIGGFSLGLERAGMRTVAFCEIDPYCRRVLAKHWPDVPIYEDVRTFAGVPADVICGGFPCQDISVAGKGAGIEGSRSGLWSEYARIIGEVRPKYVIVENVAALLGRGLGRVLGDLAALGYDAEWHCVPASAVGADHVRERVWIVANSRCGARQILRFAQPCWVARQSRRFPDRRGVVWQLGNLPASCCIWAAEPSVGRVAHGVPARVHRLRALGNAVVPQIAEVIGRAIMRAEGR